MCDLLWSDPAEDTGPPVTIDKVTRDGWGRSIRGTSYVFSPSVVEEFHKKHDLDLIVRGHQVMEDGYEFFADKKLLTIFSAPNYCGEYDNDGAMLRIDEDLKCSFLKRAPSEKGKGVGGRAKVMK